jgi:hypothetical protein
MQPLNVKRSKKAIKALTVLIDCTVSKNLGTKRLHTYRYIPYREGLSEDSEHHFKECSRA